MNDLHTKQPGCPECARLTKEHHEWEYNELKKVGIPTKYGMYPSVGYCSTFRVIKRQKGKK